MEEQFDEALKEKDDEIANLKADILKLRREATDCKDTESESTPSMSISDAFNGGRESGHREILKELLQESQFENVTLKKQVEKLTVTAANATRNYNNARQKCLRLKKKDDHSAHVIKNYVSGLTRKPIWKSSNRTKQREKRKIKAQFQKYDAHFQSDLVSTIIGNDRSGDVAREIAQNAKLHQEWVVESNRLAKEYAMSDENVFRCLLSKINLDSSERQYEQQRYQLTGDRNVVRGENGQSKLGQPNTITIGGIKQMLTLLSAKLTNVTARIAFFKRTPDLAAIFITIPKTETSDLRDHHIAYLSVTKSLRYNLYILTTKEIWIGHFSYHSHRYQMAALKMRERAISEQHDHRQKVMIPTESECTLIVSSGDAAGDDYLPIFRFEPETLMIVVYHSIQVMLVGGI